MRITAGQTGEVELIRLISRWLGPQRSPELIRGIGDDCALIRAAGRLLLTTDSFIEGVHFRKSWMSAGAAGRKALAANLSDIAAGGGRPLAALVSLEVPANLEISWLKGFYSGLKAGGRLWKVPLAGGNISAGNKFASHITVLGSAPKRKLGRSGAKPGDAIGVTGRLGGAMAGYLVLRRRLGIRSNWAKSAVLRHLSPVPRLAAGRILARFATSMIDISDGLIGEASHLAEASKVRIVISPEAVPQHAAVKFVEKRLGLQSGLLPLASGEEYELLATIPTAAAGPVSRLLGKAGVEFRLIGKVCTGRGVEVSGIRASAAAGFDHFRS